MHQRLWGFFFFLPGDKGSFASSRSVQFLQSQLLSQTIVQAWVPRGLLCQLPLGWLATVSRTSGKRDLREFVSVWEKKKGGWGGLDSDPVFAPSSSAAEADLILAPPPHPPYQIGAPWHPGDSCPTKLLHPPPQKPILLSLLSIFFPLSPLLSWPRTYSRFSRCAHFSSIFFCVIVHPAISSSSFLLFTFPFRFIPSSRLSYFLAAQCQERVESCKLRDFSMLHKQTPPIRVVLRSSSLVEAHFTTKSLFSQQLQTGHFSHL